MEEQDYIELNTLLAKLRVVCFKEIGNPDLTTKERERNYKLVRNIDSIRKQMPLKIEKQFFDTTTREEKEGLDEQIR